MPVIQLPEVVGMTLCKRMHSSVPTGRVSLVVVFQALHYRHFPLPAKDFTAYAALTDGAGEGTMNLVVMLITERSLQVYAE